MTFSWHQNRPRRLSAGQISSAKKGFTLIELLIVMVILAILVGIVIISVGGIIGRGQQTGYDGERDSIRTAVTAYYVANTEWPTSDGEPGVIDMNLLTTPSGADLPYLDEIPKSASDLNCPDPDIVCTGHYIWSVGADARVTSACIGCPNGSGDGYRGVYP